MNRNTGQFVALFAILMTTLASGDAFGQVSTELVAFGFDDPVYVTAPAGDPNRLFVVEQPGRIRLVKNGVLLATPFLDVTSEVNSGVLEQGLLGLAFHPNYDQNGFFYIYFTGGTGAGFSTIRRYTVSANPDEADAASAHTVFRLVQPTPIHNGAHLEFGPSGYLHLGLGDGGPSQDPMNSAQNPQEFFGKLIRIDVDGDDFPADSLKNYAIPPTNPFVGDPTTLDEIWALGLRNPYRFSFDPLTQDLYIGDVGQFCWEEIDFQPATSTGGENYGWRVMEGAECFDPLNALQCTDALPCDETGLTPPLYQYWHEGGAGTCWSIVAGAVYRGSAIPSMQGHFFFGDYCEGKLWTLRVEGGMVTEVVDRTVELDPPGPHGIVLVSGFGRDGLGELYVIDYLGEVFKIVPNTNFVGVGQGVGAVSGFRMSAGRPNPFRESIAFEVTLPEAQPLVVSVFSAAGRLVRRLYQGDSGPGGTRLVWDGRDRQGRRAPAGVYFLRAEANGAVTTQQAVALH